MKKLLIILLCLSLALGLAACGENKEFTGLELPSASFVYDGSEKTLSVVNLPEGATVEYSYATADGVEVENAVNAGNYSVTAKVSADGYKTKTLVQTLIIEKADAQIIAESVQTLTYTGSKLEVLAQLNHSECQLTFSPEKGYTQVGSYDIIVSAAQTANYKAATKTINFNIIPRAGDAQFENLKFEDKYFKYDANLKTILVDNLPEGAFVIYKNNSATEIGEYTAEATVMKEGYEPVTLTAKLTIGQDNKTFTGLSFENKKFAYDSSPHSIFVENVPAGATVVYENNDKTQLGDFLVKATVSMEGYNTVALQATMTIYKSAMTGIIFEEEEFVYDGTEKVLLASGIMDGATVIYTDNTATNAGRYFAQIKVSAYGYRDFTKKVMFTILKGETIITAEDNQQFDCDGLYHNVQASLNHSETVLATLVKVAVPGTYQYTLSTTETQNYMAASKTLNIIINKVPIEVTEYESADNTRANPITLTDNSNIEKVVTQGFDIAEQLTRDDNLFVLPKLIADHMLLQANVPVRVWGEVSEGNSVAVRVSNTSTSTSSVCYMPVVENKFVGYIAANAYGLGYKIEIITDTGKYTLIDDVAFGELFIAGGQSNMGWAMNQCYIGKKGRLLYNEIIASSANDSIRLFSLRPDYSNYIKDEPNIVVSWASANSSSVSNYSAVAYFFAREMYDIYKVPIGMIASCMGGTSIYTWMPRNVYEEQLSRGLVNNRKNGAAEPIEPTSAGSKYFNAMIYSIKNVVARGVIWYQGEGHYENYAENFVAMIQGWRDTFERQNLYFATVGMPRMSYSEESYFYCRLEHKKACTMIDGLVYSSNVDTGLLSENVAEGDELNGWGQQLDGIHPYDKLPVGTRLADAFAKSFYAAIGTWSGPTVKDIKIQDERVIITFDNVGSGLMLQGLAGFQIGERNKQYVDATPVLISDNIISLSAKNITAPVKIRYGFSNRSTLIEGTLTDFSQSVCVYNKKFDEKAYPLSSFEWILSTNA